MVDQRVSHVGSVVWVLCQVVLGGRKVLLERFTRVCRHDDELGARRCLGLSGQASRCLKNNLKGKLVGNLCQEFKQLTWALEPPMPKELTLTLLSRASGHDSGSVGTLSFLVSKGTKSRLGSIHVWHLGMVDSLLGFGLLNLMLGGMVLFSRAKTALMMLVMPDAPSECPVFGLTYERVRSERGMTRDAYRSNVDAMLSKDIAHGSGLDGVTSWCTSPMTLFNVSKKHQMAIEVCAG